MRFRRAVAVMVAGALVAGACSSGGGDGSAGAGGTSNTADIDAGAGGTIAAGPVTVAVAAGALGGDAAVTVRSRAHRPERRGTLDALVDVDVDLSGAALGEPARVRFEPPASAADDSVFVVAWEDRDGAMRWVPTATTADGHIEAQVDHFSKGFLGTFDVAGFARQHADKILNYLKSRAGVKNPSCGDEAAARAAGLEVTSDHGDEVRWCVGVDGGRTVVRVANNRRIAAQVTYPSTWEPVGAGGGGISLDALNRGIAGGLASATVPKGRAARIVSAGDTLTLAVPSGAVGGVEVESSVLSWLLSALGFGVDMFAAVAGAANATLGAAAGGTWERILARLGRADPFSAGWRDALEDCTEGMTEFTDRPLRAPDTREDVNRALRFAWKCLPGLMKADIAETGVKFFAAGLVIAAVATVVSLVTTAAHLLLTVGRELWDAATGGVSSVVYRIGVRRRGPTAPSCEFTDDVDPVLKVTAVRCERGWRLIRWFNDGNSKGSARLDRWAGDRWEDVAYFGTDCPGGPVATVAELQAAGVPDDLARAWGHTHTSGCEPAAAPPANDDGLEWFATPTANIVCMVSDDFADCEIIERDWSPPPQPASCELDWGNRLVVDLSRKGAFLCHGDTLRGARRTAAYGTTVRRGPFECRVSESGVACDNRRSGNGFSLSRSAYELR